MKRMDKIMKNITGVDLAVFCIRITSAMNQTAENINTLIAGWYEAFQGDLLLVGQRLGYTGEELNDLLHQFFLNLMEKNIDFSDIENPRPYLQTAFKRRLIDHYRSEKRYSRHHSLYVVPDEYQPSVQELLEKVQANTALIEKVRKVCNRLPGTCRTIILLKYGEGLSNEEIEQKTGLSRRTIYNNLFKAIKKLRKELADTNDLQFMALVPALLCLCINDMILRG
ncbi:MAG: sigma-70 family RNA polymerase sigma factor [Chitinophagaceae bacterium]|nr:sigma-70 family RNA polymerase sigma factor [Chitinophagaceae bacterium]